MYKIIIAKRKLMSLNIYARQRLRHYQQHHMRINWNLERMHEWWFIFNIQTHLDYIFAIDLVVAFDTLYLMLPRLLLPLLQLFLLLHSIYTLLNLITLLFQNKIHWKKNTTSKMISLWCMHELAANVYGVLYPRFIIVSAINFRINDSS